MKYKLFRSLGKLDQQVKKHELVAVLTGDDICSVTDRLIKAVKEDLAESPEYQGCETDAYAPEPLLNSFAVEPYTYGGTVYNGSISFGENQRNPHSYNVRCCDRNRQSCNSDPK